MITVERMSAVGELRQGQDQLLARSRFETFEVMGVQIAVTSISKAMKVLTAWLEAGTTTRLVTFTNVHMLTESQRNREFLDLLRKTDMNCPDGTPLVWLGKQKGKSISQVSGPDFMPAFCAYTASLGYRHFFCGGGPGVAERVISVLRISNPDIQIAGYFSLSFGVIGREEDEKVISLINKSRSDIVWVCLGCPKQERWMFEHRERLNARLILAVGMAFDIVAGQKRRAPAFVRAVGMEWFYRLITEPRRLAWRYLYSNSVFLYTIIRDAFLVKAFGREKERGQTVGG